MGSLTSIFSIILLTFLEHVNGRLSLDDYFPHVCTSLLKSL